MNGEFVIATGRLASGRTEFLLKAGKEFFQEFGNTDILSADITVDAVAEKNGRRIGLDLTISGTVTVPCDRCLEDLELEVSSAPRFLVKTAEEEAAGDGAEEDREVLLADGSGSLDLSQAVYDYVILSLPMVRTHGEGGCSDAAIRYLAGEGSDEEASESVQSPFAALKGLFEGK